MDERRKSIQIRPQMGVPLSEKEALHPLFGQLPQLLHLRMVAILVRKGLGVAGGVESAGAPARLLVQQQADGRSGSLPRRADEGAEEEVGQGVEPHLHTDDVGGDHSRVGGMNHNAPLLHPSGQVEREESERQLGVAVDGDAPEGTPPAPGEEIRKVQMSDGIGARHHIDHPAAGPHQGEQQTGQQVGTNVVDADGTLQSLVGRPSGGLPRKVIDNQ